MDFPRDSEFPADLSPLAWVQEELRRSLESVHKTLRRVLRDNESRSTLMLGGEPQGPHQLMEAAAAQLHQLVGVVSVVGLPAGAKLLGASERALRHLATAPHNLDLHAVEAVERAHFALLALITRMLAGNAVSTLALFPSYRDLSELAQAERVHPADLWHHEWTWREVPGFPPVSGLRPDAVRNVFESALLKQMRAPAPSHARLLSELCAGLGASAADQQSRTLWQLASAQFEAQAQGLLQTDNYAKRLGSRLLSQLRAGSSGEVSVSDRLGQDLLFFCAQARLPAQASQAPRLNAVRAAYHLESAATGNYEDQSLGRIDPNWVAQAKRRVHAAKEGWSAAAEGESHRLASLSEQFAALSESLGQLFPEGAVLGEVLQRAVVATLRSNQPPVPHLAMEVATAILYIEAALDDAAFDQPEQAERVRSLARRVSSVARGEAPEELETWMEDLYRRVSDRQTLGSVVHELRASLTEIERQIDEYFRDPAKREVLIPVPGQLQSMRGVLSVLGMDQAALACVRMRDEIDALASTEVDPSLAGPKEIFDRLANNLGALGFLIDMLSVQPQLAKRMFHFDEVSGSLNSEVRRQKSAPVAVPNSSDLLSQVQAAAAAVASGELPAEDLARSLELIALQARAADETSVAEAAQSAKQMLDAARPETVEGATAPAGADEARAQAAQSLNDLVAARTPVMPELPPVSAPIPEDPAALDQEMLEIFLAEAEEVCQTAREALQALGEQSQNLEHMTTVRRAFHTLKGSSRMVGLNEFGEAGWACEQLYNARLSEQKGADKALLDFTHQALDYFDTWVADIGAQRFGRHSAAPLRQSADALRLHGQYLPLVAVAAPEPVQAAGVEPVAAPSAPEPMADVPAELPPAFAVTEINGALSDDDTAALPELSLDLTELAEPAAEITPVVEAPAQPPEVPAELPIELPTELPTELPELGETLSLDELPELGEVIEMPVLSDDVDEVPVVAAQADDLSLDLSLDALAATPADPEPLATEPMPLEMAPEAAAVPVLEPLSLDLPDEPADAVDSTLRLAAQDLPSADALGELLHLDLEVPLEAPQVAEAAEPSLDLSLLEDLGEVQAAMPELQVLSPDDTPTMALPIANAQADVQALGDDALPAFELPLVEPADAVPDVADALAVESLDTDALDLPAVLEVADVVELADVTDAVTPVVDEAVRTAPQLTLVSDQGHAVGADDASALASDAPVEEGEDDESVKVIGPLRISISLFNIFLNEADELSRRLSTELSEWSLQLNDTVPAACEALAHKLAGNAATVGYEDLSDLARALEHALERAALAGRYTEKDAETFVRAAEDIRRLLHQFAAGFLKPVEPGLVEALQAYEALDRRDPLDDSTDSDYDQLAALVATEDLESDAAPLPAIAETVEAHEAELPVVAEVIEVAEVADIADVPDVAEEAQAAPVQTVAVEDFPSGEADHIDDELFPIFEEEADDLLQSLHAAMREWQAAPADASRAAACMRHLHTFKGGARLAGAMQLGELAHELESSIERLLGGGAVDAMGVMALQDDADALEAAFERLRERLKGGGAPAPVAPVVAPKPAPEAPAPVLSADAAHEMEAALALAAEAAAAPAEAPADELAVEAVEAVAPSADVVSAEAVDGAVEVAPETEAVAGDAPVEPLAETVPAEALLPVSDVVSEAVPDELLSAFGELPPVQIATPAPVAARPIDWAQFASGKELESDSAMLSQAQSVVRVRGPVLERMATQAGEVSIRRARLEGELGAMKTALVDLEDNLERLRAQLRELEVQAEAQMGSSREVAKQLGRDFDPLEFDRYTRFQELTRMMAESVNDVATVQRSLLRNVQLGEDELAGQSRLTRELQDDLLRTRMVEFESLAERMHRVVRQASREVGKQVQLEITGGHVELDRSVLERLIGSFEHLLRNSVIHGIESPQKREAAGKAAVGHIHVQLAQEGNEVVLRFTDDGAGLNLPRIRERGIAQGLIKPDTQLTDEQLMALIFAPGFSTAHEVTELAGRGVGMDVVRSEVNTLGGYVETQSREGMGTSFALRVPLTTALTQVVQLRCGDLVVAVPANLIDSVLRLPPAQVEKGYESGALQLGEMNVPMYWLGGLLQAGERGHIHGRTASVVLVRSAHQRVALHVDEVVGNQEVVIKNLGPQLIHVPGLAGISLLASGDVALIYNPVALANVYGEHAQALVRADAEALAAQASVVVEEKLPPLVLVVDDSLTVRRVTQRLLEREGYRVKLAKDGLDAMEQLAADELPGVVLSDIEMPRMDGFDLVRNLRADPRLKALPVIMITSRIAQKHRDYAHELGVDDYLGKPYDEDLLLSLIARYTAEVPVAA
ncbi:Hpt domain-containing protein [Pelomonas sp. APW6]|uniref:histidine kinase n=1 Tax=Roseateles subflavus TaxID=3053353 RepID=A0ABT7LIY4_9BURK|nr:Hpt domain-containing protein [Pelomonas sp. APW6]MDL5032789.1 Hpt domain-containing protein [Pelomonas sp. APW6]